MEYISSGSDASPYEVGYFYRMKYPQQYKTSQTKIIKFERDYRRSLEYTFYGLFPLALNSTSVSYTSSDILKATASFAYERYVCGRTASFDIYRGQHNNLDGSSILNAHNNDLPRLIPRTGQSLGNESGVRLTYTPPGSVIPQVISPARGGLLGQDRVSNGEVIGIRRV